MSARGVARRPLVALVPSYDRPALLARTLEGLRDVVRPDDIRVLAQPKGHPLGSGEARRRLCAEAVAAHGPDCVLLSLDDDATFVPGEANVAWAADLFDDPRVGIVQLTNRRGPTRDHQTEHPYLYHVYLLRGALVAEGLTYEPDEYADELTLSLRAWLAGWTLLRTQRARVLHHVTPRGRVGPQGGGREGAFAEGHVPVRSTFLARFRDTGLVTCQEGTRAGVALPTPYASVRVTPLARRRHQEAARARTW